MKNSKVLVIVGLALIMTTSCSQWKLNNLTRKNLLNIPNGTSLGNVSISSKDNVLMKLSMDVTESGGRFYVADNIMNRLQVFDGNGKLELVIGKEKFDHTKNDSGFNRSSFNFGSIGVIAVDSEKNIYVQNSILAREVGSSVSSDVDPNSNPSYILVFDKKGTLQYTIGQRGKADSPFYYIENLFTDHKDRLFVISRTFDSWSVSRFTRDERDFTTSFNRADFLEKENNKSLNPVIENLKTFNAGDQFVVSVSYYQESRFKYRKIYLYDIDKKEPLKEIMELPDPRNALFDIVDDKYLYLWNMDSRSVKFIIYTLDGDIINNLQIEMQQTGALYEKIKIDDNFEFYTFSIFPERLEVFGWK